MFDDLFNASFLTLIVPISAAAALSAFDADAVSTLPTTLIAQTHLVALPTVVVIGRPASMGRNRNLTSDE